MTIEQISVFIENKPGRLVELLDILGKASVDMRAMTLADTADFGILRIIADYPEKTLKLILDAGYVASITQVLAVAVPDTPGGLTSVLRILSDSGLSLEYLYVFVSQDGNTASAIIRVDDNEKAEAVLSANGIKCLEKSAVYKD